jgi:hypothetical protein
MELEDTHLTVCMTFGVLPPAAIQMLVRREEAYARQGCRHQGQCLASSHGLLLELLCR